MNKVKAFAGKNIRDIVIAAVIILLAIFVNVRSGGAFLTFENISDTLTETAVMAIMSVGMMLVLLTGGIDLSAGAVMGLAGMTVTEERLESVNFSTSYATGIQSVIVVDGNGIETLDDLAGKKIGVQLSTTGDIYASGDYGDENVIKYNKGADAVLALIGGDVQAVIIDNEPAKSYLAANPDAGLKILDTEYAVEEYAAAIKKENTELLNAVNAAIEEMIQDGTIDAIIEKYIPTETAEPAVDEK